jgi:hypothetical protein
VILDYGVTLRLPASTGRYCPDVWPPDRIGLRAGNVSEYLDAVFCQGKRG